MTDTAENSTPATNVEVVVYVLAEQGGGDQTVHLEQIASRAFDLRPGAFRWDLDAYAHNIDKDKVRVSLTDAQKPKYGALVRAVGPKKAGISKPTDAWRLTPSGVEWVVENSDRLAHSLGAPAPALKKGKAKALRERIHASDLYTSYASTGRVEYAPYGFADLLECSPDASTAVVQQRFDELDGQVRLLRDPDLQHFLSLCAAAHREMLTQERRGEG